MKRNDNRIREDRRANPLAVACRYYYWKPMAAFFNAFHLRAYALCLDHDWEGPTLDAGCHDGAFGCMLSEMLGKPLTMTGLEYSPSAVEKAKSTAVDVAYGDIVQGSATEMPFPDGKFRSLLFNATLSSLFGEPADALREASRVLMPGGTLVMSVCTPAFEKSFLEARIWRKLGLPALAQRHVQRMNRRIHNFHAFSPDEWKNLLQEAGFNIKKETGFFPETLTPFWSFLAWWPWRILSGLRLLPIPVLRRFFADVYARWFRRSFNHAQPPLPVDQCGYILYQAENR